MGNAECNLFEVEESFVPCQRKDCHHHFSWGMKFGKRIGIDRADFTETDESRKSLNCMCLLREPLSQPEIAKIFGVSHQQISLIEEKALNTIRKRIGLKNRK